MTPAFLKQFRGPSGREPQVTRVLLAGGHPPRSPAGRAFSPAFGGVARLTGRITSSGKVLLPQLHLQIVLLALRGFLCYQLISIFHVFDAENEPLIWHSLPIPEFTGKPSSSPGASFDQEVSGRPFSLFFFLRRRKSTLFIVFCPRES